jgi:hypothetical protein
MIHNKTQNTTENINESVMNKPDFLPEKFWDNKTSNVRLESLAKSYIELEKKMSNSVMRPENDDDKSNLLSMLGRPDKSDDYDIKVEHGMFDIDADLNNRLHNLGFTQDQVQAVYDAAEEKLVPVILEMSAEFQADREVERLIQEFGGADKWQEVSRQLLAFGQKNLPEDVLDSLSSSYDGVMTLFQMMKSKNPSFNGSGNASNAIGENDLKSMMRDPKYWREKDPAFIAKVTEGFESLYQ